MSDKIAALLTSGTPVTLTATPGTVLFTNTSGEESVVRHVRLVNTSAAVVNDIRVSVGADAAATRQICGGFSLPANTGQDFFFSPGIPLTGTTAIQGSAGTTAVVSIGIWGTRRLV